MSSRSGHRYFERRGGVEPSPPFATRHDTRLDIRRECAQRTDSRLLLRNGRERVIAAESGGVTPADLVDQLIGAAGIVALPQQVLRSVRPERIGMWVIGFECDDVVADLLVQLQRRGVGDEAGKSMFAEHLAGQLPTEVLTGPTLVLVVPVHPVEQER